MATAPKIVLVKLVTGEEIIGKLAPLPDEDLMILSEVMKLHYTGRELVSVPFFMAHPSYTGPIPFVSQHVLTVIEPPEALLKVYVQQNSGLDLSMATL